MIMSIHTGRQYVSRRCWINARVDILSRLLVAVGFVNANIRYSGSEQQLIIRSNAQVPVAAHLLAVIDPVLERWGWPVTDVWENYTPTLMNRFYQIRIDIVD